MEHNWKPKNFQKLEGADRTADGFNPFCGDLITVYLKIEGERIVDIGFQGSGCAISRASASMMTESIKGKTEKEAREVFESFHAMLTRGPSDEFDSDELGDLAVLSGVSQFPVRVKCATLSWHTLQGALSGKEAVTTE